MAIATRDVSDEVKSTEQPAGSVPPSSTLVKPLMRHRLATSKKLDVDVYAEYAGETWCATDLRLRFEAGNPDLYRSEEFSNLTKKLGTLIESECDAAQVAAIYGYTRDEAVLQINGRMLSSEGWHFRGD